MKKNIRDLNEYGDVQKRGGRVIEGQTQFLNLVLEDDTGQIIATVSRFDYDWLGKPLVDVAHVVDWYLWTGTIRDAKWRKVTINKWIRVHEGLDTVTRSSRKIVAK